MNLLRSSDLLEELQSLSEAAHSPTVLVDVDSTLLHVHKRNEAIFHSFLREVPEGAEALRRTPALSSLRFEATDWGWKEPFKRAGFLWPEPLMLQMEAFWDLHFFSGRFLHKDYEFEGAAAFLNGVKESTSARVFYLTARDEERMGEATRLDFESRNFPVEARFRLWLKPTRALPDAEFKAQVCRQLTQETSAPIYLIDNEPTVLHAAQEILSSEGLIRMDSVHSGRVAIHPAWRTLKGWA